jgi:quinol monooxygenase YgiN
MYGLIGNIRSQPGKRDELAQILLSGSGEMPGCLSYVIALDPADENGIWVTEVWTDSDSHRASLELQTVKDAIASARPLIAAFETHVETRPLNDGRAGQKD